MSPENQRIALAKWAGWKLATKSFNGRTGYRYERGDQSASSGGGLFGWGWQSSEESARTHLPDYLHDLNAVHRLEEQLDVEQCRIYSDWISTHSQLISATGRWIGTNEFRAVHTTAAQRCEALLRTLGLWEA